MAGSENIQKRQIRTNGASGMKPTLTRCGYRCNLCLAYRPNIDEHPENRQKLSDGWHKYFGFRQNFAKFAEMIKRCPGFFRSAKPFDNLIFTIESAAACLQCHSCGRGTASVTPALLPMSNRVTCIYRFVIFKNFSCQ